MNGFDQRIANWAQFALLVITIMLLALHGEERLSKIEQAQIDTEREISALRMQIDRIEVQLYKAHE